MSVAATTAASTSRRDSSAGNVGRIGRLPTRVATASVATSQPPSSCWAVLRRRRSPSCAIIGRLGGGRQHLVPIGPQPVQVAQRAVALRIVETQMGACHTHTAWGLHSLAIVLRALAVHEARLGADHPSTNGPPAASTVTWRPRPFRPVPPGQASGGGKQEGSPGRRGGGRRRHFAGA